MIESGGSGRGGAAGAVGGGGYERGAYLPFFLPALSTRWAVLSGL